MFGQFGGFERECDYQIILVDSECLDSLDSLEGLNGGVTIKLSWTIRECLDSLEGLNGSVTIKSSWTILSVWIVWTVWSV